MDLRMQDVQGPASYTTGGVKLYPSSFGVESLAGAASVGITRSGKYEVKALSPSSAEQLFVVMRWFDSATGDEVANATDLSSEFIRCLAVGV